MIEINSIQIMGSWSHFNITWNPVQNVNYGIVFYEIKVVSPLKSKNTSTVSAQLKNKLQMNKNKYILF